MPTKGEILVIDDDPDFCSAMQMMLTGDGFSVRCASQGAIGLRMMREKKPDLVFLDVIMRVPTEGVWVSEEIANDPELSDVPVVFLTSIVSSEYAGHFPTDRPLRVKIFLDKPVPMAKVLELANRFAGSPSPSSTS